VCRRRLILGSGVLGVLHPAMVLPAALGGAAADPGAAASPPARCSTTCGRTTANETNLNMGSSPPLCVEPDHSPRWIGRAQGASPRQRVLLESQSSHGDGLAVTRPRQREATAATQRAEDPTFWTISWREVSASLPSS
jgi:hypothetical protein